MAAFFVGVDSRLRGNDGFGSATTAAFDCYTRAFAGMTPRKVRGCSFTLRVMSKNAKLVVPALVSAPKAKTTAGFKFTGVGMAP